jgi:hypothetical protein
LTKEVGVTRFKSIPTLIVGCIVVIGLEPAAAANPKAEIDIRDEVGKVLIAGDQVRTYDWSTHTVTLAPTVRSQLAEKLLKSKRLASGVPFAVTVGGNVVYKGILIGSESSRSVSTPVILVDPVPFDPKLHEDQLRIQLGYPTTEFFKGKDPRADKRIQDALKAFGKLATTSTECTKWVAQSLREMQTIKPGTTREELMRVFIEEGGISTRFERRYAYRDCPHIKVDVKFESVGAPDDKLTNYPKDKVKHISKPFLEWPIND